MRRSLRTRLALMAATAAVLASVATSFGVDYGVIQVGRTASGRLGAITFFGSGDSMDGVFESVDGGLTWTNTGEQSATLEKRQFMELGEREPSGIFFRWSYPHHEPRGNELLQRWSIPSNISRTAGTDGCRL